MAVFVTILATVMADLVQPKPVWIHANGQIGHRNEANRRNVDTKLPCLVQPGSVWIAGKAVLIGNAVRK